MAPQAAPGHPVRLLTAAMAAVAALHAIGARAADINCEQGHLCKNDAKCIKVPLGAQTMQMCVCKAGFTGWDCSVELDFCGKHCRSYSREISCHQALCNQGACVNQAEYPFYNCNCGAFYSGQNCEIEYNPCSQPATNPCDHGECTFVRGTNQVLCQCHRGWTTNPNQQVMKLNWNGAEIFVSPPCSEQVRRGITGSAPNLGPKSKVIWYIVFFLSLALFIWVAGSMLYKCLAKIATD